MESFINQIQLKTSPGNLPRESKPFFQPKLTINNPNDKFEQEADAVADKVMQIQTPSLQKKPDNNSFFKTSPLAITPVQRKCTHCDDEEKMQRKEIDGEEKVADNNLENYVGGLSSAGQSLPNETRNFYEPRFGYDFSNVKIHTDAVAAKSAQSINALAYTSGSNIVFNSGQFSPNTDSGKKLLGHELTHVVQQKGVNNIQRKVSLNFPSIKDKLTKGIFDWAVTDNDAHQALLMLKQLNQNDLRDTVAAMEKDDLIETFFDNVSSKDQINESEFLQQVQNYRTHSATQTNGNTTVTVSSTFSCSLEQGNVLYKSMTTAKDWLDKATARLNEYLAAPGAPGMQSIRNVLQLHVHTLVPAHIQILLNRLQAFKSKMFSGSNLEVECAAPTDGLCKALAAAYVQHGTPKKMRFCSGFFSSGEKWRIQAMIHEAMHAFLPNANSGSDTVTDRAYAHERVYEFLSPEEAFDNSDSIAMLVQVLALGQSLTNKQLGQPHDDVSDCNKNQTDVLRPAIARAARWNLNAINVLADTRADFRKGYAPLRKKFFNSDDVEKIPDILETYQDSKGKFDDSLSVECEMSGGACSGGTPSYYRSFIFKSSTLHVCPAFFLLGDEDRIRNFLSLAIMNSAGKPAGDAAKYADFAKELTDKYWGTAPSL